MEIISDFSEICNGTVILCKENEVVMPAYVLNNFNDVYYLYVQNRIIAIEMQHYERNKSRNRRSRKYSTSYNFTIRE